MKSNEEKKRHLKNGSYSAALTVAVVAVLVVVNLLISALPSNLTKFDISEQQRLNFSDQTKDLIGGLDKDVTIYFLTEQGSEDGTIEEMVAKYGAMSSRIQVVSKDTALDPDFVSAYTSETVPNNSLIVECGERSKVILYSEIYVESTSTNSSGQSVVTTEFDGEGQLTSAIDFVTSDQLPTVYTLSGHKEAALSDSLISQINKDNLDVESLSLLSMEQVPEDCDALIINGPQQDLSQAEASMIGEYLQAGGQLIYVADYLAGDLPNLEGVLLEYGISFEEGVAVESDSNYYYQYPHITIPQMHSHAITDPLIDSQLPVVAPLSRSIEVSDLTGVDYTTLFATTSGTYLMQDDTLGDQAGVRKLGVIVEKETADGAITRVVAYGSQSMFTEEVNTTLAVGNYDLFANTLGYLCEHESAISIRAKSMDGTQLALTSFEANLWSAVVVVLVPAALLVVGVVIWIRRRRR